MLDETLRNPSRRDANVKLVHFAMSILLPTPV
jgi:hypothetical protein